MSKKRKPLLIALGALVWFFVEPFTGDDGRLSWTKIVVLIVVASYWHSANLPASVAIAIIVSSYGVKYLMQYLKTTKLGPDVRLPPPKNDEPGD